MSAWRGGRTPSPAAAFFEGLSLNHRFVYKFCLMQWDAQHPLELEHPRVVLIGYDDGATLRADGQTMRSWSDPLEALRWLPDSWADRAIPHGQQWIGFLNYDLG